MFTGNKAMVIKECDRLNASRRVANGTVDHITFFQNIEGDLLVSGYIASDVSLIADMITEYAKRDDIPTIVLSGHNQLFEALRQKRRAGELDRVMISDLAERNYHPFYGMNAQKFLHFVHLAAESLGYSVMMDQVLQYASAVLSIISVSYPVSLAPLMKLLQYDDDYISNYALQIGLSNVIADNIRANHEAGIILRRVCEKLYSVFEDVAMEETDTKYNFQSGAQGNVSVMAFYSISTDQQIMNSYLKEELFFSLKRVPRVRVIIDEMEFSGDENDELLKYLFAMKRQGKIELIFISRNAGESTHGMQMNFANVVLSSHDEPAVMEALSKSIWGTYQYNYPAPAAGKPPAVIFTLKKDIHWHIDKEERLRVRAVDLYARQGLLGKGTDLLALKTTASDTVFFVPRDRFIPTVKQLAVIN